MKNLFFILFLLICVSCQNSTSSKPDFSKTKITKEDKEKLHYLKEVEWPKAYREQDTILLDRILAKEFQMIDASGNTYYKKDELDWIKKNATQNDSFFYEIKRLDFFENGTAVVSGTGHIYKDTSYNIYQSSNILIKRNSEWKAISSHVSGYKSGR